MSTKLKLIRLFWVIPLLGLGIANAQQTRALNEINAFERAESYPYLTSNGLKLYFVQSTIGGTGSLMVATRSSSNFDDKFGTPSLVTTPNLNNIHSFSLSTDELTIFYTTWDKKIYKATRTTSSAAFSNGIAICLCDFQGNVHKVTDDLDLMLLSTPSFTSDLSTLYLYYNYKYNGFIFKFSQTTSVCTVDNIYPNSIYPNSPCSGLYYRFNGRLESPFVSSGNSFYSGQLDKTGSNYDFSSLDITKGFNQNLSKFISISSTPAFQKQADSYNFQQFGTIQPSFNTSRNVFAFVTSTGDWLDNDISITYSNGGVSLREDITNETTLTNEEVLSNNIMPEIKLFPNPATNSVEILSQDTDSKSIKLFSSNGQLLLEKQSFESSTIIDLNNYQNGIYYVKTTLASGKTLFNKLLITK